MPTLKCKTEPSVIRRVLEAIRSFFPRPLQGISAGLNSAVDSSGDFGMAVEPPSGPDPCRRRLAEAAGRLEQIEAERERLGNPKFDKISEERIVWRELIELEMQEVDERMARMRNEAGRNPNGPGARPVSLRDREAPKNSAKRRQ